MATGAAWVYTKSGSTWQTGIELTPNDNVGAGDFGNSAALSADGNTDIIGGPNDNGPGAAWIFTRSGNTWAQQGNKLLGTVPANGVAEITGWSVAISADGNTAIVGEPGGNSGLGGSWVYTRNSSTWTKQSNELADASANASQGYGVALSADGSTAIAGGNIDNMEQGAAWAFIAASNNATLASPGLSNGTLSPAFATGATSYTASVSNTVTSVTVTPATSDPTATIAVNGTAITSGSGTGIALNVGSNTIATIVTAQDGVTTITYTIIITRALPALPNISYAYPQTYTAGTAIAALAPANTGGAGLWPRMGKPPLFSG